MKIIYSLLICCIVFPCKAERFNAAYDVKHQTKLYSSSSVQSLAALDTLPDEIITVPVVFHVLYNDNTLNLSDAQVQSQIESLNKDYSRSNNISNIPAAFSSLSADVKINFCIAN